MPSKSPPVVVTPPILLAVQSEPHTTLIPVLMRLLDEGHDPSVGTVTELYSAFPVCWAVSRRRMDVLALLIDHGADEAPLCWSPLHRAVALGSLEDVRALGDGPDIAERGFLDMTPFLLAVALGDVEKAALLLPLCDAADTSGEDTALNLACHGYASRGSAKMGAWLIAQGFDPDEAGEGGYAPIMKAAISNHVEMVEVLLRAGVRIDLSDTTDAIEVGRKSDGTPIHAPSTVDSPASLTENATIARMLFEHGAPVREMERHVVREMVGCLFIPGQTVTHEQFEAGRRKRVGHSNPEEVTEPFWLHVLRTNRGGHHARRDFGRDYVSDGPAVWSHDRMGMTTTLLPDGRWVQIAGEHEDSYDPDFCIYADVLVFDGMGGVQVFVYPADVFMPTDFHSATLVGDRIVIIGNLGYPADRRAGHTPVQCLNLTDFSMSAVATTGMAPGWIMEHTARHVADGIVVEGGRVWDGHDLVPFEGRRHLCLTTFEWSGIA